MEAIAVQGAVGDSGRKAVTKLPSHSFNSLATINGFYFGANSSGLHLLNTGNQFNSTSYVRSFTMATTDFLDSHPKHIRFIYINIETDNDFNIGLYTEGSKEKVLPVTRLTNGLQTIRVQNKYSDVGRNWRVRFFSEGFFRVNDIKIIYYRISRGSVNY